MKPVPASTDDDNSKAKNVMNGRTNLSLGQSCQPDRSSAASRLQGDPAQERDPDSERPQGAGWLRRSCTSLSRSQRAQRAAAFGKDRCAPHYVGQHN